MEFSNKSSNSLIVAYKKAAALQGEYNSQGNPKKANQQYKIMAKICRALRKKGESDQLQLISLLNDQDPYVRLWAATHSLEFAPRQAERGLKKIASAKSMGVVSFLAATTLYEWKKGSLTFP